ncbi:MAG: ABC transporter substrate-binding protein, partial [Clostridium sp.]
MKRVGVPQNRVDKYPLIIKRFGDNVDIIPMINSALPFALEKGEVDAILIDALTALSLNGEVEGTNNIIPNYTSYTMVVS